MYLTTRIHVRAGWWREHKHRSEVQTLSSTKLFDTLRHLRSNLGGGFWVVSMHTDDRLGRDLKRLSPPASLNKNTPSTRPRCRNRPAYPTNQHERGTSRTRSSSLSWRAARTGLSSSPAVLTASSSSTDSLWTNTHKIHSFSGIQTMKREHTRANGVQCPAGQRANPSVRGKI